jgi:pimeloyl-ACP methyl ester carboxylesterase
MADCIGKCDSMYLLSRGSGDPVLFLHGMPTSSRLWDPVIDRMFHQHTCIAVDLPGLGRTPKTDHGFQKLDELTASIENIRISRNIERWNIVGHDAGCAIAVHYSHQFQQRVGRLALLSPSMFPDLKPFCLFEILRKPVIGELMAPAISLLFWNLVMRWALEGNENLDDLVADFHGPFSGWRGAWRLMSLMRWGNPEDVLGSVPALLPELLIPTLIFHGSKDRAVPEAFAKRAKGLIPNSEVMLLNSGHFLPLSEPQIIARELCRFFEAQGRSTPQPQAVQAVVPVRELVTSEGMEGCVEFV